MTDNYAGLKIPLGELTIGGHLGEGGFGVVHKASLAHVKMPFAVKFLDPHPFNKDGAEAERRFLGEAETLFTLRHPYIAAIFGVGEHEGKPYILMEYFDGMDLMRAREKHGTPEPETVLPFLQYIAEGLQFAHKHNVVHRDIKPRNLMTKKGDARILDFGIAGPMDPDGLRLTRTGATIVGDAFSAPELTENPRLVDPRCDIFSLGACWFWLLTGQAPKGHKWERALRASVTVSSDYERVLLRCLDPAESRHQVAAELIDDLKALQSGEPPPKTLQELTDDDAMVIGTICGASLHQQNAASLSTVEKDLHRRVSRLRMSVSLNRLKRMAFITEDRRNHEDGQSHVVLVPGRHATEWVEHNVTRIEHLLSPPPPPRKAPIDDDGIPF